MPPKPSNTHSRTNSQTVSQTSSHTANSNRQSEVQQQVNEVIGIMHTNIDKVMQRGEKLDSLEEKTSQLKDGASTFKKQAKKVESIMWWKNAKLMCICISVLAIIIGLVAMTVAKNYKMIEQSLGASPSSTPTGTPK
ncbi:synaptobrevin-domain-containing protein [Globomyces pollinis-pini]|nr:synaptobrevin-domain-containing protein [Globomyces pollinis-pini]